MAERLTLELNKKYYAVKEFHVEKTELVMTTIFDSKKTYVNLPYSNVRKISLITLEKKKNFFSKPVKTEGMYIDFQKVSKPVLMLEADMPDTYAKAKEDLIKFAKDNRLTLVLEETPVVLVKVAE